MPKADDPYYNRTRIPDEFIQDVGYTGLTPQEEFLNREKKYMVDGVDVRRFSNSKTGGMAPQDDPYYGRRRLSKQEIHGVAETGLSPEEEYLNRERKFSVNGVDVRKFGSQSSGGLHPPEDPYYNRKKVSTALTSGIGDTGNAPAADYEVRERKQSMANFSGDPFAIISGSGQRQSVSAGGAAAAGAEATRRRSSAVAPDTAGAAHTQHNAYGGPRLEPIDSKPELPPVNIGEDTVERNYGSNVGGTTGGYGHNTTGTGQNVTGTGYNTTGTGQNVTGTGYNTTGTVHDTTTSGIGHSTTGTGHGTTGIGHGSTGIGHGTTGTGYDSTGAGHHTGGTGLTSGADTSAYPTTTTSTSQNIGSGTSNAVSSSDHGGRAGQASYYDAATSNFDDPDSVAPDVRR